MRSVCTAASPFLNTYFVFFGFGCRANLLPVNGHHYICVNGRHELGTKFLTSRSLGRFGDGSAATSGPCSSAAMASNLASTDLCVAPHKLPKATVCHCIAIKTSPLFTQHKYTRRSLSLTHRAGRDNNTKPFKGALVCTFVEGALREPFVRSWLEPMGSP